MRDANIKKLVLAALMAALTYVATSIVQIPSPMQGYVNLGDCIVLLSGWILGPWWGAAAGGIGSMLVDLIGADFIVSVGRGISKDVEGGIKLAEELAEVLGGVVGSSRACVDAGWITADHQVGQTGKTVHPKVYVALGISGAIQHKAGMQDSECIIAVNKNENAPIFEVADYGIVGDLFKVVPELIESIKAAKAAQ